MDQDERERGDVRMRVVAREEFEAWLLADVRTLHSVCKQTVKMPPSPEQLERSEAKRRIEQWIAKPTPNLSTNYVLSNIEAELARRTLQ